MTNDQLAMTLGAAALLAMNIVNAVLAHKAVKKVGAVEVVSDTIVKKVDEAKVANDTIIAKTDEVIVGNGKIHELANSTLSRLEKKFEVLTEENKGLMALIVELRENAKPRGIAGPQGPPGDTGPQGEKGEIGPKGKGLLG